MCENDGTSYRGSAVEARQARVVIDQLQTSRRRWNLTFSLVSARLLPTGLLWLERLSRDGKERWSNQVAGVVGCGSRWTER